MKNYNPVIIEATDKQWKAWMAMGNTMLVVGFTLLVFSALSVSGTAFWMGFGACLIGGIASTFGKLNAWWDHG